MTCAAFERREREDAMEARRAEKRFGEQGVAFTFPIRDGDAVANCLYAPDQGVSKTA
jgi:hypothetical protein